MAAVLRRTRWPFGTPVVKVNVDGGVDVQVHVDVKA
jgi:hypothetical protein